MKFSTGLTKKHLFFIIPAVCLLLGIALWLFIRLREPRRPKTIAPGDYSYAVDYAEHKIKSAMKKYRLPGVIFAMMDGDRVILSKAYGYADLETRTKATPDTVFKAGSISKVFTGIAVMRLQEEGLIDIRNPLTDYLPDFEINDRFPDPAPISVQSILEHRSGLPRGGTLLGWAWDYRPHILRAQMESLRESHMVYPVGFRYKYSNIGYNVLGNMIEVVRGLEPPSENSAGAFPYYILETIFSPLEMHDTGNGSSDLMYGTPSERPVAMGYYRERGRNVPYNQFDIIELASGNVHTTLNDMVTFTTALLTADENSLIKRSLLTEMYKPRGHGADLKNNGLTWFRNTEILGDAVIFHDGTNQGFISMLAMIPEYDIGLVIMANSDEFENVKNILTFDILRVMLETKTGKALPDRRYPEIVTLQEDILRRYTGKYLMNGDTIDVYLKNGELKARYNGFKINLDAVDENSFVFKNPLFKSFESRFAFFPGNDFEEPYMILEMGDVFHCPRYPVPAVTPRLWEELVGKYTRHARHPSAYSDTEVTETMEITLSDGILLSSGGFALLPVDNSRILIQSGVFHGETMEYNPGTGVITWQHLVYEPLTSGGTAEN